MALYRTLTRKPWLKHLESIPARSRLKGIDMANAKKAAHRLENLSL